METAKKPSIYDVARKASVSVATVSRVINHPELVAGGTRDKVNQAMKQTGFIGPAADVNCAGDTGSMTTQKKKPGRSAATALVDPLLLFNMPYNIDTFFAEVVRGAQSTANMHGYNLLIDSRPITNMNVEVLTALIKNHNIQGLIVAQTLPEYITAPLSELIPIVQCSEYNPDAALSYVSIDNYTSTKKAMDYLFSIDCRDIVFVNTPLKYLYSRLRQKAYLDAQSESGLSFDANRIIYVPEVDFDLATQRIDAFLLENPVPDAIFAISDVFASAAIKSAQKFGLSVPNDLSVIGFDDIEISKTTTPSITTISQPKALLGQRAVEILIGHINEPKYTRQVAILPTELIIRDSSK